jgi:hypothetical protein
MAESSVGLRIKCDCSGKAQKQFNSKLQTRFLVREDALIAKRRNCPTKEEKNKLWSRVPKGGPIPRLTGRVTVGRKKNGERNAYRLLVGKPEGKRPLGRSRRRWVDNISMDLGEVRWGDVYWIGPAKDRNRWRALVNSVLNLRVQ